MTIFSSRGFDTLIGKGTSITGTLTIAANSTTVIDGIARLTAIDGELIADKVAAKTTLRVGGMLTGIPADNETGTPAKLLDIYVQNVIITGNVQCETIHVEGTLAVKAGATLKARKILYRELIIETGAVVHGSMSHLDHSSEGEVV